MSAPEPQRGDALLIVDVQNDFLPGGARLPVVATRDWHPPDHCSFQARGGPWPAHCVAGTEGAAFARALRLPPEAIVISKATEPDREAYSGFEGTGLAGRLRELGVRRLLVGGLATDYCVLSTVRDARREGFDVVVLEDAVRAVDLRPGDGARALEEMRRLGAELARTEASPA